MNKPEEIMKLPEDSYEAAIRKYSKEGAHIPGDDASNPWVPFGDAAAIKQLSFDVRTNSVDIVGEGRRQGIGALALGANAKPGDFVYELPGAAHTCIRTIPTA